MKKKIVNGFFVKLKELNELREFGRHLGGDFSETLGYYIRMSDGSLIPNDADLNEEGGFHCFPKHILDNGQEYLVIDHPNIITKREYDTAKALYDEVDEEENRSMKGVC